MGPSYTDSDPRTYFPPEDRVAPTMAAVAKAIVQASPEVQRLRADLKSAESVLFAARKEFEKAHIKVPFDATVADMMYEVVDELLFLRGVEGLER